MAKAPPMTVPELRELNRAWARRKARVPANFGSHLAYCEAVERGLLQQDPAGPHDALSADQIAQQLAIAASVPMPPWRPRPKPKPEYDAGFPRMPGREDE